jgi:hypothetical protein
MAILSILWPNGIFYGRFAVSWYIFSHFGMLHRSKSGNPEVAKAALKGEMFNFLMSSLSLSLSLISW